MNMTWLVTDAIFSSSTTVSLVACQTLPTPPPNPQQVAGTKNAATYRGSYNPSFLSKFAWPEVALCVCLLVFLFFFWLEGTEG